MSGLTIAAQAVQAPSLYWLGLSVWKDWASCQAASGDKLPMR
ncbi:hypothetical protein [Neisseria yangbaofengii]|nr:hypothetical protein [Neisseria yangbaofengii]